MFTPKDTEAELSYAYLHAVAAEARLSCTVANRTMDNECIDATLHGVSDFGGPLTELTAHIQLKATINQPELQDNKFAYFLKSVSQYNNLRSASRNTPKFLVVLFLPRDQTQWVKHDMDSLILRKCAFWASLAGAPATTNDSGITVFLPQDQVVSPEGLRSLFGRLSNEENIHYGG